MVPYWEATHHPSLSPSLLLVVLKKWNTITWLKDNNFVINTSSFLLQSVLCLSPFPPVSNMCIWEWSNRETKLYTVRISIVSCAQAGLLHITTIYEFQYHPCMLVDFFLKYTPQYPRDIFSQIHPYHYMVKVISPCGGTYYMK